MAAGLCTAAKLDTFKLNGILKDTTRARELLRLHAEHGRLFDRLSFGTTWSRLGRVSAADRGWLKSDDGARSLSALNEETRR